MELYYKNETLFVTIYQDITIDTITLMKRRIFKIIDDYGVATIILNVEGFYDKELLNAFKREYYHHYKGFLLIK